MSLKIIHLLTSLNQYGGTPRKTYDLCIRSRFFHEIFCCSEWGDRSLNDSGALKFINSGLKVSRFRHTNLFAEIKQLINIVYKAWQLNPDIVHCYFDRGIILGPILRFVSPSSKIVLSCVGERKLPGYLKKMILTFFLKRFDGIIYVSSYVQSSWNLIFPALRKLESKIIANGAPRRFPLIKKNNKEQDRYILLTIGGLNEFKNLDVLIKAIRIIKENSILNPILKIAGDGHLKPSLERLINELGLQNDVQILGYVEDIGSLLKETDIYLHPAVSEGFGIAVIEAMRSGIPVIVSNKGALPEIVQDGVNGLIVDYSDASLWASRIISTLSNKKFRRILAAKGFISARSNFRTSKFVIEHDNFYSNLCNYNS